MTIWIDVEDQMPNNDERVIFVTRKHRKVCYGYFNRELSWRKRWTDLGSAYIDGYESTGYSVEYDDYDTHEVACWTPMPEAPK